MNERKTKVLVFGTFDLLHPGHVELLSKAATYGEVIISLTPDELLSTYKGRKNVKSFQKRAALLEQLRFVSQVLPSDLVPNSYTVLKKVQPSVIYLGYDQRQIGPMIRSRLHQFGIPCKVMTGYPYRPTLYHSSILKVFLSSRPGL